MPGAGRALKPKLMKIYKIALPVALALLAFAPAGPTQPKTPVSTKEFMREKLQHSQKLLAALATEDFFTLEREGQRLSAMTTEASWEAFQNPDYAQYSANFRKQANSLVKAAKSKNVDSATLAYVSMTMSCVECHKFVRGRLVASRPPEQEFALINRIQGYEPGN
jgi:cytochrome c556